MTDLDDPTAAFAHDGDDVGVVLCHGFTGSPASMRPWADALVAAGHSVRLPLLPGHGAGVAEANLSRWEDWYLTDERAYLDLAARCRHVFAFGLSMGGALALRLAQHHRIDGLVLVNPAVELRDARLAVLPLLRRLRASIPAISGDIAKPGVGEAGLDRTPLTALASMLQLWADVRAGLDRVNCPVLAFRSKHDHVVGPGSMELIENGVTGPFERRELTRSFHVATLDYDAPEIIDASLQFLKQRREVVR